MRSVLEARTDSTDHAEDEQHEVDRLGPAEGEAGDHSEGDRQENGQGELGPLRTGVEKRRQ